jgi:Protein of unknown function (DUF2798)
MNPQKKFQLVFALLMGAMMFFVMSFVITCVNIGWTETFFQSWARTFGIAYLVGVPMIYFLAPVARRLTDRIVALRP